MFLKKSRLGQKKIFTQSLVDLRYPLVRIEVQGTEHFFLKMKPLPTRRPPPHGHRQ